MKTYTVNQLAQLAGISVRALHHYDNIGLLRPAFIGGNRYRYYGEEELLRLQQILINREMGMGLAEIGLLLDVPGFNRLGALQRQRQHLEEQAKRYAEMVRTIDRTIALLNGERKMTNKDLYSGIVSPQKQAEYEAWLVERYGAEIYDDIDISRQNINKLTLDERADLMNQLESIEQGLVEALRRGIPSQAASLDPLIARHRDWVSTMWNRPASLDAYFGLADTYMAHPDFAARYETLETGFTEYLATAMQSWVKRQIVLS